MSAVAGYEQSVSNLARVSLAGDMVFGLLPPDGQMATLTGSNDEGWTSSLSVPV